MLKSFSSVMRLWLCPQLTVESFHLSNSDHFMQKKEKRKCISFSIFLLFCLSTLPMCHLPKFSQNNWSCFLKAEGCEVQKFIVIFS